MTKLVITIRNNNFYRSFHCKTIKTTCFAAIEDCNGQVCHGDALCVQNRCVCNDGHTGDGNSCTGEIRVTVTDDKIEPTLSLI